MNLVPFFIFIVFLPLPTSYSMSDSDALLQLKKSFTNTVALNSWESNSGPCAVAKQWIGLVCYDGAVVGIRLEGMGLSGTVDVQALNEITTLRSLSIENNSFSGAIPEFNRLGTLKGIFISGNQFSGEIPSDYFSKMLSLKKLWLANNKFTGTIPSSIQLLPHLLELHLENNQFTGTIPGFDLPALTSLDLSNNKLQGIIPGSLMRFNASSFSGNPGLCGEKSGNDCSVKLTTSSKKSSKVVAVVISVVVVIISLIIVAVFVIKRRRKEEAFDVLRNETVDEAVEVRISGSSRREGSSTSSKRSLGSKKGPSSHAKSSMKEDMVVVNEEKGIFGMLDLMRAAAEVLGTGSLGSAYKAVMSTGVAVVVKRMKDMNRVGKEGFDAELRRLGALQHPNVLNPLGYHFRKEEKLIIYEYIPKGSLLYVLHGDRGACHVELHWPARLKIVKGIVRGLAYLHSELASLDLPHGNLKSSNVLLTFDYEPLLSDYGFSPLISVSHVSQALFAYKSPEAVQDNLVSPKCDVYCLGIIILEVLIGKFPMQYLSNSKGGTDVVEWAVSAIADAREVEVFDPEIASSKNSLGEMVKLLHIGVDCVEKNPDERLDLQQALKRIEELGAGSGGSTHDREIEISPSFRDVSGEVDAPPTSSQSSPREEFGEISLHREDGVEEKPGASYR